MKITSSALSAPAIAPAAISPLTLRPTPALLTDTGETTGRKPDSRSESNNFGSVDAMSPTKPILSFSPFPSGSICSALIVWPSPDDRPTAFAP